MKLNIKFTITFTNTVGAVLVIFGGFTKDLYTLITGAALMGVRVFKKEGK